jgi:hypothetical protein
VAKWIESADRVTSCARCKARIEIGQRFYYLRRGTYLCEMDGSIAEHDEPEIGSIESGVMEDLSALPEDASKGTIAQMMIAMARRIDNGDVADRDVAPITKEIRQMHSQLKLDFPPEPEDDETEKRRKRRERLLMIDGELYD